MCAIWERALGSGGLTVLRGGPDDGNETKGLCARQTNPEDNMNNTRTLKNGENPPCWHVAKDPRRLQSDRRSRGYSGKGDK
jgi:hypothetical protein